MLDRPKTPQGGSPGPAAAPAVEHAAPAAEHAAPDADGASADALGRRPDEGSPVAAEHAAPDAAGPPAAPAPPPARRSRWRRRWRAADETPRPRRRWKTVAVRLWDAIGDTNMDILAAGVALFAILSLMPAIAALVSIYGAIADPADIHAQLRPVARLVPPDVVAVVAGQMTRSALAGGSLGLGFVVSLILALFSAMGGVGALMKAINVMNGQPPGRPWWLRTLLAFALSVGGIATVGIAVGLVVVLPTVLHIVHLDAQTELIISLSRWPALFALIIGGVALLYWLSPAGRPGLILPGAALATALWLVGSVLLSLYVDHIADYNDLYGAFGGLLVLLLWFYVSAFVVLLGAAFNHELQVARTKPILPF